MRNIFSGHNTTTIHQQNNKKAPFKKRTVLLTYKQEALTSEVIVHDRLFFNTKVGKHVDNSL